MHNNTTPYERLGGEDAVRSLVDRFYDYMDSDPGAADVRRLHARDLRASREKLFLFLSGWLGGPNLYVEKFGHPRLRARHLPFPIDSRMRDQWMHCMTRALEDMPIDTSFRQQLREAFASTADHMRNRAEHTPDPALKTSTPAPRSD
jgi:hemoglobin